MNMGNASQSLRFKTTINCGGCVASVTPHLNDAPGIAEWEVDTTVADKILTVKSAGITVEQVVALVEKAGFKAEPIA